MFGERGLTIRPIQSPFGLPWDGTKGAVRIADGSSGDSLEGVNRGITNILKCSRGRVRCGFPPREFKPYQTPYELMDQPS
jgi:hypothetical protein